MNFKKHLILFAVVFFAWAAFYLMGIPFNYFLNWSTPVKILIIWIGLFSIFPFFSFLLAILLGGDYFKTSLWIAFYACAGPFIFDTIAVGMIEGKGMSFLVSHWYLTAGYIEALIVMPLVGLALRKFKESN